MAVDTRFSRGTWMILTKTQLLNRRRKSSEASEDESDHRYAIADCTFAIHLGNRRHLNDLYLVNAVDSGSNFAPRDR